MKTIENLSDITLDLDTLQKRLHSVEAVRLAIIDFEGEITPEDSQKKYLETYGRRIGFTSEDQAKSVLWKEIRQPYLKNRVQTGRWVSSFIEPDETKRFYDRFLLKRPAEKTIEEMMDVGKSLKIGHGAIKTLKELEEKEIKVGIISGTLLPFLKGFMEKPEMKRLQPISLYAADVNVEDGLLAELQTKPYMHSQKITLMDDLIAYGLYGEGEVGVIDDGVSGIELFKAQKRIYRPIAFNTSDHLLKEISIGDSLECFIVLSDDFRSVLPLLLGKKAFECSEIKQVCEKAKYFEKRTGEVWSELITGLGNYSPETGRPENLHIDNSIYKYRQDVVSIYRDQKNSLQPFENLFHAL